MPPTLTDTTACAQKAHGYATWLKETFTLVATIGGPIVAAAVVMARSGGRASGATAANVFLDLGLPDAIVPRAGASGYLYGSLASSAFRLMGHMVHASAINERLQRF